VWVHSAGSDPESRIHSKLGQVTLYPTPRTVTTRVSRL
jgi:hypothetical protein